MAVDRFRAWYRNATVSERADMWSWLRERPEAKGALAQLVDVDLSSTDVKFERASGDCICHECAKPYFDHPSDHSILSFDGYPFLNMLCDGSRVKL